MKKVFVLLLSLTMFLSSCIKESDLYDFTDDIGIVLYEPTNEFRTLVIDYAVKTATSLGYDYQLKLPATAKQQEDELLALAEIGVEVIVFGDLGVDPEFLNKLIHNYGVQIVLYDGEVDCDYTAFVSGDNVGLGERGGEFFKALPDVTKIVTLTVPSSTSCSDARIGGFKSTLGTGRTLVEVPVTTQSESALLAVLDKILAANPDGVYTQDDIMAYTLVNALDGVDHNIKAIFGAAAYQPFLRIIKNNPYDIELGTATYSPEYIKKCVNIAADLILGYPVENRREVVASELIDKTNVDKYLKDSGNF